MEFSEFADLRASGKTIARAKSCLPSCAASRLEHRRHFQYAVIEGALSCCLINNFTLEQAGEEPDWSGCES